MGRCLKSDISGAFLLAISPRVMMTENRGIIIAVSSDEIKFVIRSAAPRGLEAGWCECQVDLGRMEGGWLRQAYSARGTDQTCGAL